MDPKNFGWGIKFEIQKRSTQKRRKKPFKIAFMSATYSKNFFREGAPKFAVFSNVFFSGRIVLKNIDNKKGSRGSGGMLPRKIFENLHTAVAILALFEQF